jgi:hypothetical protein
MPSKFHLISRGLAFFGLTAVIILGGCGSQNPAQAQFEAAFRNETRPYSFNYAAWETATFASMLKQKLSGSGTQSADDVQFVFYYFQTVSELERLRSAGELSAARNQTASQSNIDTQSASLQKILDDGKPQVEKILSEQISLVMAQSGIYNPWINNPLKITFPPVTFQLESSLNILVISPRDKIQRVRETILQPEISLAQSEELETRLEGYDVSALVIPLGGLGATYPSFVIESSNLEYTLKVIVEEWLHQFMLFRPLGFQYVLELSGFNHDPDIATLNETIVGIAAEEIGGLVFQKYYRALYPPAQTEDSGPKPGEFDFNAAMRATRLKVDAYLAAGQVEEAESYMEKQRQILVDHGYAIRKLNQAYFAFYGSYAYGGTSVDPLGDQAKQLRKNSPSLQKYIETASSLTSRKGLQNLSNH